MPEISVLTDCVESLRKQLVGVLDKVDDSVRGQRSRRRWQLPLWLTERFIADSAGQPEVAEPAEPFDDESPETNEPVHGTTLSRELGQVEQRPDITFSEGTLERSLVRFALKVQHHAVVLQTHGGVVLVARLPKGMQPREELIHRQ